MENKTKEEQQTVYSKVCPYCNTKIISMYEKQLDFNFSVHEATCQENPAIKLRNKANG
jgi:hypothetical protein